MDDVVDPSGELGAALGVHSGAAERDVALDDLDALCVRGRLALREHASEQLVDSLARGLARRGPDEDCQLRSRMSLEDPLHDLAAEEPRRACQKDVSSDSCRTGDRSVFGRRHVRVHALPFEKMCPAGGARALRIRENPTSWQPSIRSINRRLRRARQRWGQTAARGARSRHFGPPAARPCVERSPYSSDTRTERRRSLAQAPGGGQRARPTTTATGVSCVLVRK